MRVVHLTASTFFGGPERQILGLADTLRGRVETTVLSFAEGGRAQPFIDAARRRQHPADILRFDTPRLIAATNELTERLRGEKADLLLCHGYKSDLIGRWAARRAGIPVVAVSRGWTGESRKIRVYESLDRRVVRGMDAVVCVSDGQAEKVRDAGVNINRIRVIRNASRTGDFGEPTPQGRAELAAFAASPGDLLMVSAVRLSPEKGVGVLVAAARSVVARHAGARFIVFGEGAEREWLQSRIEADGLSHVVSLPGFRDDLDRLLPNADLMVLPSFTEGLPNVVLEASAAGVPVVATAVGGTPEAIDDGVSGRLVPAGDSEALARVIAGLLDDPDRRRAMGRAGQSLVRSRFSFTSQGRAYLRLFGDLGLGEQSAGTAAA